MTQTMNTAKAKGKLSSLVAAALAGEIVELPRAGKPVVRLVPIVAPQKRRIGILKEYVWTGSTPIEIFDPEPDDQIDTPFTAA
jgi:antitoxin (DNA-binding transcriptional repressor) of toxin-antitoxin stability system